MATTPDRKEAREMQVQGVATPPPVPQVTVAPPNLPAPVLRVVQAVQQVAPVQVAQAFAANVYKEFELWEPQIPHVERLRQILLRTYFFLDTSVMGAGKTITTSFIIKTMRFRGAIIVAPVTALAVWTPMREIYDVPILMTVSYESLRSVKGQTNPGHGLLTRADFASEGGANTAVFTPTQLLRDWVEAGIFVGFDECHKIKNKTDQFEAAKAISTLIVSSGGRSRFGLLSGTPVDKDEHAVHMMQFAGIIRKNRLFVYHKEEARLELIGAQELVNYCNRLNQAATEAVLRENGFSQKNVQSVCYQLFVKVVQPSICSSMPPPINKHAKLHCRNLYLNMSAEEEEAYIAAVDDLHGAALFNERNETVEHGKGNLGAINKALGGLSAAIRAPLARRIMRRLAENPNLKITLYTPFSGDKKEGIFNKDGTEKESTIDYWIRVLAPYNPLVLRGSVPQKKRPAIIAKFQEHNLNHRVLLSNFKIGSSSISLDDCYGDMPRESYAEPSYFISDMHQCSYRSMRGTTRSDVWFYMAYGKCAKKLVSIINALARKKTKLKDTLEKQVEAGIVFPGDYEDENEPDPGGAVLPHAAAPQQYHLPGQHAVRGLPDLALRPGLNIRHKGDVVKATNIDANGQPIRGSPDRRTPDNVVIRATVEGWQGLPTV